MPTQISATTGADHFMTFLLSSEWMGNRTGLGPATPS